MSYPFPFPISEKTLLADIHSNEYELVYDLWLITDVIFM